MKISKRLHLLVAIFCASVLFVGAYGLWSLVQANERSEYVASVTLPKNRDLEGVIEAQTFARLILMRYSLTSDAPGKEKYKGMTIGAQGKIGTLIEQFVRQFPPDATEEPLLANARAKLTRYREQTARFFEVTETEGAARGQELLIAGGDLDKATAGLTQALKELIAHDRLAADQKVAETREALASATKILCVSDREHSPRMLRFFVLHRQTRDAQLERNQRRAFLRERDIRSHSTGRCIAA